MIDFERKERKPKQIETNTSVLEVIRRLNVTVRRLEFLFFIVRFRRVLGERWNDYEESSNNDNSGAGSSGSSTRKKDFVELDGRWRSTNPSIFEEGFNKAEDIANKVKELVMDQRHPSHEYSPDIR